jgi:predicted PurR-regulated permease PerM
LLDTKRLHGKTSPRAWHEPCSIHETVADTVRRQVRLEIPWRTFLKIFAAFALGWCLLRLIPIVLMMFVAVIMAVALEPLVEWLERRRLGRAAAAILVGAAIVLIVGGFFWLTWSSLAEQWDRVATEVGGQARDLWSRLPSWMRSSGQPGEGAQAGNYAVRLASSVVSSAAWIVLGLFLTIYLLVEGRRTYAWLIAFVPQRHRSKVERTAAESREVIAAYIAGNVITSIIAFACTLAALSLLNVPAALLLAVIAGLSDFVPVIGFVASSIPALVLALTVSPTTALLVAAFYVAYNTVEAYVISPWAYGDRMKLSDVAVILGFAAGAQLGGVIGALIALPIAALYPTIERVWLRRELPQETAIEHEALAHDRAADGPRRTVRERRRAH